MPTTQELVRTGFGAVRQVALTKPEAALRDIREPELDGLAATEQILRQQVPPTIVALTTFDQNEYIDRALRAARRASSSRTRPPDA